MPSLHGMSPEHGKGLLALCHVFFFGSCGPGLVVRVCVCVCACVSGLRFGGLDLGFWGFRAWRVLLLPAGYPPRSSRCLAPVPRNNIFLPARAKPLPKAKAAPKGQAKAKAIAKAKFYQRPPKGANW